MPGPVCYLCSSFLLLSLSTSFTGAAEVSGDESGGPKMTAATFSGLKLRSIGPALTSGRIADLAIDPVNPNTWYVAAGSGNVWKTVNAGTTFTPIFDDYGSYSIGCVTIDPNNRHTIWVGTGENVGGRHVGFGDGVYRSRDGGDSFENVGSESIGTHCQNHCRPAGLQRRVCGGAGSAVVGRRRTGAVQVNR